MLASIFVSLAVYYYYYYYLGDVVRSHLMNVDLLTMFNPHVVDSLNRMKADCESCAKKLAVGKTQLGVPEQ